MRFLERASIVGLSTAFILSSVSPVLAADASAGTAQAVAMDAKTSMANDSAAPQISKEKAIELFRSFVTIPEDYVLQSVNYNSNFYNMDHGVWNLSFSKKTQERYYGNAYGAIDATTGKLINFHIDDNDPGSQASFPPKTDLPQAKEIAQQFIAKVNPEEKSELIYNDDFDKSFQPPLNGNIRYNIRFDRTVHGIRYAQNQIGVTIDGNGKVLGYDYRWDNSVKFQDEKSAISLQQATKSFQDKLNLSLTYKLPWRMQQQSDIKPYLSYQPAEGILMLDAGAGELLNFNGDKYDQVYDNKPLTDKPLAEAPSKDLNLTQEQALAKAKSVFKIPDNAVLNNASYQENTRYNPWKLVSSWNMNWRVPGDKGGFDQNISLSVNSKSSEIMNFGWYAPYNGNPQNQEDPKISMEQAKASAIDFIKKILPYDTNVLYLFPTSSPNMKDPKFKGTRAYNFNFKRLVNGIGSENENVNVAINADTGEVMNFYNQLSDIAYPDVTPDVLPPAKAKDLFFSQYNVELRYFLPNEYLYFDAMKTGQPAAKPEDKQAKLVYQLVPKNGMQQVFLDAVTGNWRSADTGELTSLEKVPVKDIDGHWAQKELQLMLDYKALEVKEGKVAPDESITRGEMVKMLVAAMNGGGNVGPMFGPERKASFADVSAGSPYFNFVETAVDRKLLDRTGGNFDAGANITRDDLAEMIVRALGYYKLAQNKEIFAVNLQDSNQVKHTGQVAIVSGLGIMTADGGYFHPDSVVTRAQAATAFHRFLQKRTELQ